MKSVCVYCGSSSGARPLYVEAARAFGRALVEHDLALIYGGGKVGLMGTIADTVMEQEILAGLAEARLSILSEECGYTASPQTIPRSI